MIRRFPGILLFALLLPASTVHAAPLPWMISNLNPWGESTLVHHPDGSQLDGDYLVQLLVDRNGDGVYGVRSALPGDPFDIGDDSVLVEAVFNPETTGFAPPGGFLFYLTVDPDSAQVGESRYFVRVFDSAEPDENSRFSSSNTFSKPGGVAQSQTFVPMPPVMSGYLDNLPPIVTLTVPDQHPLAGEVVELVASGSDDETLLQFSVDSEELPGGADAIEIERISDTSATIRWTIPGTVEVIVDLPILVNDGDLSTRRDLELDVLSTFNQPSSFSLISPYEEGPAFEGLGFRWRASHLRNGANVSYTFEWSLTGDFTDADSITGLNDTTLVPQFTGGLDEVSGGHLLHAVNAEVPHELLQARKGKRNGVSQAVAGTTVKSNTRGKRTLEANADVEVTTAKRAGEEPVVDDPGGEFTEDRDPYPLPITPGDSFAWRVKAVANDGAGRLSLETRHAWAEQADPPEAFGLVSPVDNANLETTLPTFRWHRTTDPDNGDTLVYDLLWSVDNGTSFDTLHAGADTLLDLSSGVLTAALARHTHQQAATAIGENTAALLPDRGRFKASRASRPGGPVSNTPALGTEVMPSSHPESSGIARTDAAGPRQAGARTLNLASDEILANPNAETDELDDLPQDVTILWKVDAVDLAGLRTSSESRHLTLAVPDAPSGFDLASPADSSFFTGTQPFEITWRQSFADPEDNLTYSLFMCETGSSEPAGEYELVAEGLSDTSYHFEPSDLRQNWFWKVRVAAGGDTIWNNGAANQFSLWPPLEVSLLEPAGDSEFTGPNTPFRWSAAHAWMGEPLTWHLELSDDFDFSSVLLEAEPEDTSITLHVGNLQPGEYYWRVFCTDEDGVEYASEINTVTMPANGVDDNPAQLPTKFAITSAYPNPFNPSMTVVIAVPERAAMRLLVFDLLGREVHRRDLSGLTPGYRPVHLDLSGRSTGVYFLRLEVEGRTKGVTKVTFIK